MRLFACLIVAPQRAYDEPAILSYAISSFCPTSADGLQVPDRGLTSAQALQPLAQLRQKSPKASIVRGSLGVYPEDTGGVSGGDTRSVSISYLSFCLSVFLAFCLFVSLSFCLSVFVSFLLLSFFFSLFLFFLSFFLSPFPMRNN